jgi:cardiolipin synthase
MVALILFASPSVLVAEVNMIAALEHSPRLAELPGTIAGRQATTRDIPGPAATSPGQATYLGAMAGHLANSHTGNLLLRPLSSTRDLVFLLANTARDVSKGVLLDVRRVLSSNRKPIPPVADRPAMDLVAWETWLDRHTGSRATSGSVKFLVDGDEFFPRFIESINQAKKSINVRTYIFDNDDYAVEIANVLKKRSEQVEVSILLDGIGTIAGSMAVSDTLPRSFSPPKSIEQYLERDSGVEVRLSPNIWLAGDHSKSTIIDGQLAFIGGMNIGREYRYDWHDLMAEVSGPVVKQLQRDFDTSWAHSGLMGDFGWRKKRATRAVEEQSQPQYPLRILYTKAYDSQIYRAQLAAIRRATNRVYIQNAYFSDDAILHALIQARRRGVDVRIILPSRNDSRPMDRSNAVAMNTLLRHGVRIYMYPGMSHIKAAIYDGWACFGSANFDKLSLRVNKEINIGTSSPQIVSALQERVFMKDFSVSREINEPLPTRFRDHVYEQVADLLL